MENTKDIIAVKNILENIIYIQATFTDVPPDPYLVSTLGVTELALSSASPTALSFGTKSYSLRLPCRQWKRSTTLSVLSLIPLRRDISEVARGIG